ncbi:MAG: hypothetical protein KGJ62_11115 [Armatimonadetes bacterium]|nr:hypothetical protein [Armatimonadota bacterium]MDE2208054.1 hypothetical protein [Armatimonadota bacterium]
MMSDRATGISRQDCILGLVSIVSGTVFSVAFDAHEAAAETVIAGLGGGAGWFIGQVAGWRICRSISIPRLWWTSFLDPARWPGGRGARGGRQVGGQPAGVAEARVSLGPAGAVVGGLIGGGIACMAAAIGWDLTH